jgi:hypothetical protein
MAKPDLVAARQTLITAARAELEADVRARAQAFVHAARAWFRRMPDGRWSLDAARRQQLAPEIHAAVVRLAQVVGDDWIAILNATRVRAYHGGRQSAVTP